VFVFLYCFLRSIDPNNNQIELSLKGKDVGDKDPAPKPERREKKKLTNGKRQHGEDDDGRHSESEDEGENILKKLRKGLFNLRLYEGWNRWIVLYPPYINF
jgi:hypothetical protein